MDAGTWVEKRVPRSADNVQIRSGRAAIYDVDSDDAVRVVHLAGTLRLARDKSTLLNVGLLKASPGAECDEDGFNCHDMGMRCRTALRLRKCRVPRRDAGKSNSSRSDGNDTAGLFRRDGHELLPTLINCGGRMQIHGAPRCRT